MQAFHDAVHCGIEHFAVVEIHFQVGVEVQLMGEVFYDRLEKGVDGFHPETVVVVQDAA